MEHVPRSTGGVRCVQGGISYQTTTLVAEVRTQGAPIEGSFENDTPSTTRTDATEPHKGLGPTWAERIRSSAGPASIV